MARYMRATPRTICLLFANVSPPRSCFHGDMIVPNSTVARARRTGVVQRSSTAGSLGPRRPSLVTAGGARGAGTPQRRSSVSVLPTAFENAENNTAKGRKVSIVELMIAAKREAEEAEESDDDQSRGPSRGPRKGRFTRKKSLFDIFPDDHDGEPEKPSKGKKKPKNAVNKSVSSKKVAPPKMNPPTKTAPGGAVGFLIFLTHVEFNSLTINNMCSLFSCLVWNEAAIFDSFSLFLNSTETFTLVKNWGTRGSTFCVKKGHLCQVVFSFCQSLVKLSCHFLTVSTLIVLSRFKMEPVVEIELQRTSAPKT